MMPQVQRRSGVLAALCAVVAVTSFAPFVLNAGAAFMGGGSPPPAPRSQPARRRPAAPVLKESTKWQSKKEQLQAELKHVELNLAMALQKETRVSYDDEEDDDAELKRLRAKYKIKAQPNGEAYPTRDSAEAQSYTAGRSAYAAAVSKGDTAANAETAARVAAQQVSAAINAAKAKPQVARERMGMVANAAILRTALDTDDWRCDDECLAKLAGNSDAQLSSREVAGLEGKLQEDVKMVQYKVRELEQSQRRSFSSDASRRIEKLNKFLALIPKLVRNVRA